MEKGQRAPRCWEIIGCGKQGHCQVWKMSQTADKPCWDVVGSFDDYRSALNVCGDCLVFVLHQGKPALSPAEIVDILAAKAKNPKGQGCKAYLLLQ
ncbi:MAG: hypothetical protein HGA96_13200 [Desulfobulbaceae bacterium]|nr:hypothetical protein [Desulfobulbaceae bacterium]